MSRLPAIGFATILGCVALIAYRVAEPSHLYVEVDNRDVLETIAAGSVAQASALTPTVTPYLTATPTRTPKPPTPTPLPTPYPSMPPLPTWAGQPGSGLYLIEAVPPTPRPPVVHQLCVKATPVPSNPLVCLGLPFRLPGGWW